MLMNRRPTESADLPEQADASYASAYHRYGQAGLDHGERGFAWRRHAAALFRHKWLVLVAAALGTLAGFAASRQLEDLYEARSAILIATSIGEEVAGGPVSPTGLLHYQSWVDLSKADPVLDHVVREMRLHVSSAAPTDSALLSGLHLKDPFVPGDYRLVVGAKGDTFILSRQDGQVLQRGSVGGSVGPDIGFFWLPQAEALTAGRRVDFSVSRPSDIAERLGKHLRTETDRSGSVLRLSLRGTNPERTAAVVNAVANRYVDVAERLDAEGMRELTAILSDQLDYAAVQLREARADLEEFRVGTARPTKDRAIPQSLETYRDPAYASDLSGRLELEEIRRARQAIQHILDIAPDSGLEVAALDVLAREQETNALSEALHALHQKRASLRGLRYVFPHGYREIRELNDQIRKLEQETIPRLATDMLAQLEREETNLVRRMASASPGLKEIPAEAFEAARLLGRVEAAEALFGRLQDRYDQVRLAPASRAGGVRILEPAVAPVLPIRDNRRLSLIMLGFLSGIGVGSLGALIHDRLGRRRRHRKRETRAHRCYSDHYAYLTGRFGRDEAVETRQAARRSETTREPRSGLEVRRFRPEDGHPGAKVWYPRLKARTPDGPSGSEDWLDQLAVDEPESASRGAPRHGNGEPTNASGDASPRRRPETGATNSNDVLRQLRKERFRRYQTRYWK